MAAFTYKFTEGACHKVTAQVAGEVIAQITNKNGSCTPQNLVDESRRPDAPLHNEFDWDDTIAAGKWRCEQARLLITHIQIVRTDDNEERKVFSVRAFPSAPGGKHEYVTMDNALSSEAIRDHLVAQAKKECIAFIAKYRALQELIPTIEAMEAFLKIS